MQKLIAVAALATVLAATPRAQAPNTPQNDPDAAELASYKLTAATLQRVEAAARTLNQALLDDPKYKELTASERELKTLQAKDEPTEAEQQRMEALEQKVETLKKSAAPADMGDAETLTDMERSVTKIPHLPESLRNSGLTPREFAKFTVVMLQSAMVAGFKKAGQLKDVPPGISPENVQFVIDHQAELDRLNKEMQALKGGKG